MQQFYSRNEEIIKMCTECGNTKPASEFYSNRRNKDGLNSACKDCAKNRSNKNYASEFGRQNRKIYYDTVIKEDVPKYLFRTTAQNARTKNLEHSISPEDIIIPQFCPILGLELHLSNSGHQEHTSPSIDRIDSTKGYTKDNIIVVSWRANDIKSNASLVEMKNLVDNWFRIGENYNFNYPDKQELLVDKARERSKRYGLKFNLRKRDILIPFVCPMLNIDILCNNLKQQFNSPSIDRINNELGYVRENIRVVSWRANNLKGDASYDEYKKVFNFYNKIA